MAPDHNSNSERAIIPTDNENNLENVAEDVDPDILPEDQPDQQEIQPEPDPNPEPSSPRKENTTFAATPLQSGKEIMLTTTPWSSTQMNKLLTQTREMVHLLLT